MTIRRTALAVVAAGALALTACSSDDAPANSTEPPETPQANPEADEESHSLGDTVEIGNTVTISDTEIETENCSFSDEPARPGVPFQFVATVENQTGEELVEALWPSDFSFTDADGLTVKYLDMGGQESCDSEHGSKFVGLGDGETRRAALTMTAPVGATEMIYKPSTIDGAESVTWDVSGMLDEQGAQDEGEGSDGPAPTPAAAPVEVPVQDTVTPASFECLAIADSYQAGTARYADGSTGFEQSCVQSATDEWNSSPEKAANDAWREEYYSDMGNAERSNHGMSAATPNDCDGYLGAHEDPDDSHC